MSQFLVQLGNAATAVEAYLSTILAKQEAAGTPRRLAEALRHSVLAGGKRFRPYLVFNSAALFGVEREGALPAAAAIECIHCYSLVHDDLPAMDDDALRRGRPTAHIAFDEATAILAGDSLLTYAFDIIAAPETALPDRAKTELVLALARAAGSGGMVGGQALDLAAEKSAPDEAGITTLQAMKTGALIRFACEAGAIIAGVDQEHRQRLRKFGQVIGLAFQLADDLLDITSDAETMGKATGKDAARGKGTLVAMHGTGWAEEKLDALTAEAVDLLAPYGEKAFILQQTARFIASRQN